MLRQKANKANDSTSATPETVSSEDSNSPLVEETTATRIQTDDEAEIDPEKENNARKLPAKLVEFCQKVPVPEKVAKQFREPRSLHRRYWFWLSLVAGVGVSGGAIALGVVAWKLENSVPKSYDEVLTYAREGTLTIKSADGAVLQEIGPVTHEKLAIDEIPEQVQNAFIASEDRNFREHGGVDYGGLIRASLSNTKSGEVVEGGSTITQQLARLIYLDQERTAWRKAREIRIAQKIENNYEKERILERYLNLIYLGSGAYGIGDAAWVYFSKSVDDLTLAETATLAGIAPAPSEFSPFENPELAKQRRDEVLRRMAKEGTISQAAAESAIASPLETKRSKPKRLQRQAPYFTEYVQKELKKIVPEEALQAGGVVVETTLNNDWQKQAEKAIAETLAENGESLAFEQAALVAIDPRNGGIKAMVGGSDFSKNQYNRVTQAQRQPGSTFKTFVYATAIAAGFSPNQGFMNAKYVVDDYKPENYNKYYSDSWTSMREALIQSINVIAVRALVDVGWEPTIEVAKKMGIESKLEPAYGLALGASEVNLLELTNAYGTLANKGVRQKANGIVKVLNSKGETIYEAENKGDRAIDAESAAITNWMLQGVVSSGTGSAAKLDRPVAGKTGTSDEARDLWFVGYVPQLVAGVWLGNDDNKPTKGSSNTAAAAWKDFMSEVVEDLPEEKFDEIPKELGDREGSIKAKPLKPKNQYYIYKPKPKPQPRVTATRSSGSTSRRSYSGSSSRRSSSGSSRSYTPRRAAAPARRSAPAPARRTYQAPARRSAPAPAPVRRSAPAPAPAPVRRSAPAPTRQAAPPPPPPPRAAAPAPAAPPPPVNQAPVLNKQAKPPVAPPPP
ncbi:PBP1A family penicillin-binding protein [Oscillatoria salina IIICB1]|nr:PBP1A family penicillin-binding protein [Oscillatoria salina IIICB1]